MGGIGDSGREGSSHRARLKIIAPAGMAEDLEINTMFKGKNGNNLLLTR
jgi:hypothetical protein